MKVKDNLIKQANIMMVAAIVTGMGNFLYQILMNRGLGGKDFADFSALLGLFVILSVPNMTIQTVITKRVSQLRAQGNYAGITEMFFGSLKRIFILGAVSLVLFISASNYLQKFLHIGYYSPVIITGMALLSAMFIPIGYGTLQGLQKFTALGINLIISTFLRLITGVLLVYLGFRLNGAIGSSVIFAIFGFGLAMLSLKSFLHKNNSDTKKHIDFPQIYRHSFLILPSIFLLFFISFADTLIVKHFLKSGTADYFTAAILGRSIIYFTVAIAGVMFPKVSEAEAKGENTSHLLWKSLLYGTLLCLAASLFLFAFPKLIVNIVFHPQYADTVPPLLKVFGFAFIPFGLINILVYYNLGVHRMKFTYILAVGTILHVGLLALFHNTLSQIIFIVGLSGTINLIMLAAITFIEEKRKNISTGLTKHKNSSMVDSP